MDTPIIVYILYYLLYLMSFLLTATLFYCMCRVSSQGPKACYVMMANVALLDFLICTTNVLQIPRQITFGPSMIFYPNGMCAIGGESFCLIINSLWLTFLAQNIVALSLSFGYRAYILYKGLVPVQYGVFISIFPYFISIPIVYLATIHKTPLAILDPIIVQAGLPTEGIRYGYKDFMDKEDLIVMFYAFYQTPFQLMFMLYCKHKAAKYLDGHQNLSERTIQTHRQFMKVLTIQMLLPCLHFLNIIAYLLRQTGYLHGEWLEYATNLSIHLMSALGPGVSLYNVRPFRNLVISPFKSIRRKSTSVHTSDAYNEEKKEPKI